MSALGKSSRSCEVVTFAPHRTKDHKVYLGNLSDDCRERDLKEFLKGYGTVRNISIKRGGFGFAEFDDREDAKDAIKDLNGGNLLGFRVRVEHARGSRDRSPPRNHGCGGPPGRRMGYRCVVENLSLRTSWQDLKDYMRKAGDINYTNTHHVRSGEGVVEFRSRSDMHNALDKLDGTDLDGHRIKLGEEGKGRDRSIGKSRSRSWSSRSDSRSSSRSTRSSRSDSRSCSRSRTSRSYSRSRSRSRSSRSDSRSRSRSRLRRGRSRSRS